MREIKLRAKGKLTGEWLYSNGYYYDEYQYWFTFPDKDNAAIAWAKHQIIKHETLGEFTGLHDKNGKEIYEGDVVQWGGSDKETRAVEFKDGRFGILHCYNPDCNIFQTSIWDLVEVIGNIYENEELLEDEDAE